MSSNEPPTPYDRIGGAVGVRKLVTRLYDLMHELPEAQEIREMHPANLASSREKLFEFLSGWLGGPQLYMERRGHPRLRARHLPFRIDSRARDAWMHCMRQALEESTADGLLKEQLRGSFQRLADHMRNIEDETPGAGG
jgi:hemoglobin